ncbi:MAG: GIY-YIG nuclease family protein [Bacteroidaceae bacterium]|nr:GIY-YIG nuclease family protein [Bacteroidaceae bacterium]
MSVVYILQCANGEYYVGSTTNLAIRLKEHTLADESLYRGAKFTKAHQPIELVYTEEYPTEHDARIRERQLHKWSHAKKEALIKGDIERLKQLSKK